MDLGQSTSAASAQYRHRKIRTADYTVMHDFTTVVLDNAARPMCTPSLSVVLPYPTPYRGAHDRYAYAWLRSFSSDTYEEYFLARTGAPASH